MAYCLSQFPMPPSDNRLYRTGNGRIFKSKEYQEYKTNVLEWSLKNNRMLTLIQKAINETECLAVEFKFYFEYQKLWTKKNTPKRIDTTNRLKAGCDALADVLYIDDSLFFRVTCEKTLRTHHHQDYCDILIKSMT